MRLILLVSGISCLLAGAGWGLVNKVSAPGRETATPYASHPHRYYDAVLHEPVDSICVVKSRRELMVFHRDTLLKIYRVSLGDTPLGHKHFQGDERTPEGLYRIDGRNPYSICHKNLGISYPNSRDRAYAARNGRPTGGDIKIHGLPNGQGYIGKLHLEQDWTNGCVAVTDAEIDELYEFVAMGSPILILP